MKLKKKQIKFAYSKIRLALYLLNKNQTNPVPNSDLPDIVQNTMIRIIKQKKDFSDIRNFEAWCFNAAKFERLDYFRSKKRQNKEPQNIPIPDPSRSSKSGDSVPFKTPTELPVGMILLEDCWDKLLPNENNVLLKRMMGFTAEEIKEDLSIPLGTVLDIMAKSKIKMYDCMGLDRK